jgi:hypothetical protein
MEKCNQQRVKKIEKRGV